MGADLGPDVLSAMQQKMGIFAKMKPGRTRGMCGGGWVRAVQFAAGPPRPLEGGGGWA